ncbi:MAG: glycosyltransferase family 39 protein [Nitrospinae bacterium]|nr:glycosyltransferase family 39 protein [Nitrospinota bacterium]
MESRFFPPILIMAVTVALLAVSLAIKPEVNISFDQLKYLSVAKNLADGAGARDIGDPPGTFTSFRIGYTFFMAGMIRVFGLSEWLVAAINHLLFFMFVGSVYLLGERLFGRLGATLGTLSLITIPEVITFGIRNLDAFWPALIVASILLLLSGQKGGKHDMAYGLVAGLAAGYAGFVKETSLLFLPAPAIMFILRVNLFNAGRMFWFYAAISVMALAWVGYALFILNLPAQLLWIGIPPSSLERMDGSWSYATTLAGGLADYFHNPSGRRGSFVFTRLPLASGMILAFAWSLWRAAKGDPGHKVLLVTLTAFLPLSAMAGALDLRFSQNFILVAVFCLLLGTALATLANAIGNRFPGLLKKGYIAVGALIVVGVMLVNLLNKRAITTANEHLAVASGESGIDISYSGHKNVRALNGLPDGAVIAGDFFGELNRSIFLFGKGRASIPLPIRKYSQGEPVPAGVGAVVTRVFKDTSKHDDAIFLFDAEEFLKTLADPNVKYVALPGAMGAVAGWIEENAGSDKTLTFPRRNEPPDILIVLPQTRKTAVRPASARKIYISGATFDMLSRRKTENPAALGELVDSLFRRGLLLEDEAVSEILDGKPQGLRHIMARPEPF